MAALSPAVSNDGAENTLSTGVSTPAAETTTPVKSPPFPPVALKRQKNLRGLNKPKCITCGNVAWSRCPYQSCKNCCEKAQNPCEIHVLKNANLADKGVSANLSTSQHKPNDAPPSGFSAKGSSLRQQLSSTYAQFKNVHVPLRSRKLVTRKEALAIKEWRFAKLKDYTERNIEAENKAFDRYMQNTSFLEEIFDINSANVDEDFRPVSIPPTILNMKVRLRSNPMRIDKLTKTIKHTINLGLRKVQKNESNKDQDWWAGKKTNAFDELNDLLNKARNNEDLKSCFEMRSKISNEDGASSGFDLRKESEFSGMKMVRYVEIDQAIRVCCATSIRISHR